MTLLFRSRTAGALRGALVRFKRMGTAPGWIETEVLESSGCHCGACPFPFHVSELEPLDMEALRVWNEAQP